MITYTSDVDCSRLSRACGWLLEPSSTVFAVKLRTYTHKRDFYRATHTQHTCVAQRMLQTGVRPSQASAERINLVSCTYELPLDYPTRRRCEGIRLLPHRILSSSLILSQTLNFADIFLLFRHGRRKCNAAISLLHPASVHLCLQHVERAVRLRQLRLVSFGIKYNE